MKNYDNICRFCLKTTDDGDLVTLFDGGFEDEGLVTDWRRIFSFVFQFEGIPRKICTFCKSQVNWILGYQRQVFENDCYLRREITVEETMNKCYLAECLEAPLANMMNYADLTLGADDVSQSHIESMAAMLPNDDGQSANLLDEYKDYGHYEFDKMEQKAAADNSTIIAQEQENFNDHHEADVKNNKQEQQENRKTSVHIDQFMATTEDRSLNLDGRLSFKCSICEKLYKNKGDLTTHRKIHDENFISDLKCEKCGKMFASKSKRNVHIKAVHQGYTYQCPICNLKQKYKSNVIRHIKLRHPGIKASPKEVLSN